MTGARRAIIPVIKIIISIGIILFVINSLFYNGIRPYSRYNDFYYQDNFFLNSFMTLGGVSELAVKLIFFAFAAMAACYAVWKFEPLYSLFINSEKKKGLPYAIYFSVSMTLLYNPLDPLRNEVTRFDRVIGWSIAINSDVSKRINNFTLWLIAMALFFGLFYLLSNYFFSKDRPGADASRAVSFLDNFIVLADCSLLFGCITYFSYSSSPKAVYDFSSYVIMLVIMAFLAYILLGFEKKTSIGAFSAMLLAALSASYPLSICISVELEDGRVTIGVMAVCVAIILTLCGLAGKIAGRVRPNINGAVIVCALLPLITSVFIELIHVLNRHSVFVAHPAKWYRLVVLGVLGIAAAACFCPLRKFLALLNWKRYSYPVFVFGMTCLSVQIPIQSAYGLDIFEDANYSVLINDLLSYGKIPIIEHYGGHMMTGVWEGIVYGLLNNDFAGACLSPYASLAIPFFALLFFYLLKNAWNEDAALAAAMMFPFMEFWSYYGLGALGCLAVIAYVKKHSYMRAVMIWMALAFCALYRLDIGFSFGIATVVSLAIYIILKRDMPALKELSITLSGSVLAGGAVWILVCLAKGINPAGRLMEFLVLSLSNQNWGYGSIGDIEMNVFSYSYIFIPFCAIICLMCTVFSKNMREQAGDVKWMLLLVLGFAYFFNFSRGLVRHSLEEGLGFAVVWSSYIFIAAFLSCLKNNEKLVLPVFMAFMLCHTLMKQDTNFTQSPILSAAVSKPGSIIRSWEQSMSDGEKDSKTYWESLKEEQKTLERVTLEEDAQDIVNTYALIIDTLLDENETFVDFMNRTSIYPLVRREDPVYASQSPMQLSGEFAQEQFIEEIRGIPIVLMPLDPENEGRSSASDGIANAYRYYKVAEYIYQNYVPLCKNESENAYIKSYAVWCLKERYQDYRAKIGTLKTLTDRPEYEGLVDIDYIDYGYDGPLDYGEVTGYVSFIHNYNHVEQLARIWSEGDIKNSKDNKVLADLAFKDGLYTLEAGSIEPGENGNYLKISAAYDGKDANGIYGNDGEILPATIVAGNYENGHFSEKCNFAILMKEGARDYLIRISADYYWYLKEINAIKIKANGAVYDVSMQVLEGD